ncbi:MAG: M20/M25/M40 family metallo-hydrolase [Candidatus Hodarchaeales archaeon]|jgi:acetylornithine deacetylase/succinyl-diaminopimelate desuccinylase-like protein
MQNNNNNQHLSEIIEEIYSLDDFNTFSEFYDSNFEKMVELLCEISEIPSPSFQEDKKAEFVRNKMQEYGLVDVQIDKQKNVIGKISGTNSDKILPIFAHIDTVFPMETELSVKKQDDLLICPSIGDNSSSVTVMLTIILAWKKFNYTPPIDVVFVGNSCEEGLGDLKGIKYFLDVFVTENYPDQPSIVLALDGIIRDIIHVGIGSKRKKVTITSIGGHSWGNFGNENAIHLISRCISEISKLKVPTVPKTTFNVGLISGGTSINTIAPSATCFIDIRSIDQEELNNLEKKILEIFKTQISKTKSKLTIEEVGNRPGASLDKDHWLIKLASLSAKKFNVNGALRASSTDANIPLSRGIPAITIGVYNGSGAHTMDEKMNPSSLKVGIKYGTLLIMGVLSMMGG